MEKSVSDEYRQIFVMSPALAIRTAVKEITALSHREERLIQLLVKLGKYFSEIPIPSFEEIRLWEEITAELNQARGPEEG